MESKKFRPSKHIPDDLPRLDSVIVTSTYLLTEPRNSETLLSAISRNFGEEVQRTHRTIKSKMDSHRAVIQLNSLSETNEFPPEPENDRSNRIRLTIKIPCQSESIRHCLSQALDAVCDIEERIKPLWDSRGRLSVTSEFHSEVLTDPTIDRFQMRMEDGIQLEIFRNRIRFRAIPDEQIRTVINLVIDVLT